MAERHRCTTCRNPIRHGGVARPGSGAGSREQAWFHEDCWAQVCGAEQHEYERRIQEDGLAALLAPYLCATTRDGAARGGAAPALATAG
jgi:hypothetical protein